MKYISQNNSTGANKGNNKRCFSANGFSLLPLVLEQRLFCSAITVIAGLAIGLFACSNSTFATDPFLNVTVSNSITLDLKPISTTGTFAKSDTTSSTISATTNYFAGYKLGIAASSSEADAANLVQTLGEGNEQTIVGRISSIGTVEGVTNAGISEQAFSDNSNTQYNNTWGYMLTKLNTSESTNYLPAPTNTAAITLDTTSVANLETANNYNIAIGARVDTEIPKGSYTNTFVITAVANPIPYSITYNKNAEDTVTNMPATSSGSTTAATITNAIDNRVPARTGYNFLGWCSTTITVSGDKDTCSSTVYNPNGNGTNRNYALDQTGDNTSIVLYAMWQRAYRIEFVASTNINSIMVADSNNNYKPQYAINGTNNGSTVLSVPAGIKLIVSVIPESEYILDNWSSNNDSTARLASTTLLTTTYTVGTTDETLTATGKSGSYIAMQNIDLSIKDEDNPSESINCLTTGTNVTDSRDKKSYTVAKFGNYCYMLSDLRLDNTMSDGNGGTTARVLTSTDSDIKDGGVTYIDPETGNSVTATTFTMPNVAWTGWFCRANMKIYNGVYYYYNWYTAKANPYQCTNPTLGTNATEENDNLALGSICPRGWTLPNYDDDITPNVLWDNGNPGMLATSGFFLSVFQYYLGAYGYWPSSIRYNNNIVNDMRFTGDSVYYDHLAGKDVGYPVRCMRSS